jgi:hypothetical protein
VRRRTTHRTPRGFAGARIARRERELGGSCCTTSRSVQTREPSLGLSVQTSLADSALRGSLPIHRIHLIHRQGSRRTRYTRLGSRRSRIHASGRTWITVPPRRRLPDGSTQKRQAGARASLCRVVTALSRTATPSRPPVQRSRSRSGTAAWVISHEQARVNFGER